jgi:hypothetical protein
MKILKREVGYVMILALEDKICCLCTDGLVGILS